MAKWGSQNLDDVTSIRQRLVELNRASSDQSASRSGLSLLESDLEPVAEEQTPFERMSVELNSGGMTSARSPFASASDLTEHPQVKFFVHCSCLCFSYLARKAL